jgi:hypothetical protein
MVFHDLLGVASSVAFNDARPDSDAHRPPIWIARLATMGRGSPALEIISREQRDAATLHFAPPATSPTIMCLFSSQGVDQLTLPFADGELVEEDQPQLAFALVGA